MSSAYKPRNPRKQRRGSLVLKENFLDDFHDIFFPQQNQSHQPNQGHQQQHYSRHEIPQPIGWVAKQDGGFQNSQKWRHYKKDKKSLKKNKKCHFFFIFIFFF